MPDDPKYKKPYPTISYIDYINEKNQNFLSGYLKPLEESFNLGMRTDKKNRLTGDLGFRFPYNFSGEDKGSVMARGKFRLNPTTQASIGYEQNLGQNFNPSGFRIGFTKKFREGGKVSPQKAKKILSDGQVHGKALTPKQQRFFGAMSNYNTGGPMAYTGEPGGPGEPTKFNTAKLIGDDKVISDEQRNLINAELEKLNDYTLNYFLKEGVLDNWSNQNLETMQKHAAWSGLSRDERLEANKILENMPEYEKNVYQGDKVSPYTIKDNLSSYNSSLILDREGYEPVRDVMNMGKFLDNVQGHVGGHYPTSPLRTVDYTEIRDESGNIFYSPNIGLVDAPKEPFLPTYSTDIGLRNVENPNQEVTANQRRNKVRRRNNSNYMKPVSKRSEYLAHKNQFLYNDPKSEELVTFKELPLMGRRKATPAQEEYDIFLKNNKPISEERYNTGLERNQAEMTEYEDASTKYWNTYNEIFNNAYGGYINVPKAEFKRGGCLGKYKNGGGCGCNTCGKHPKILRNGGYPSGPYYPYPSANLRVDKNYDKNHVQPTAFDNGGNLNNNCPEGKYWSEYAQDCLTRSQIQKNYSEIAERYAKNERSESGEGLNSEFQTAFDDYQKSMNTAETFFNLVNPIGFPALGTHVGSNIRNAFNSGFGVDWFSNGGNLTEGKEAKYNREREEAFAKAMYEAQEKQKQLDADYEQKKISYNDYTKKVADLEASLKKEEKRVQRVRDNVLKVAEDLRIKKSKYFDDYGWPLREAREQYPEIMEYYDLLSGQHNKDGTLKTKQDQQKLIKNMPKELKEILPKDGRYDLFLYNKFDKEGNLINKQNPEQPVTDPYDQYQVKYHSGRGLYCTPGSTDCYERAGAYDMPILSGNMGFYQKAEEGTIPFERIPDSEAQIGDMALLRGTAPTDYANPDAEMTTRVHHTTIPSSLGDLEDGEINYMTAYSPTDGMREAFGNDPYRVDPDATRGDKDILFYRYVGQTPKIKQQIATAGEGMTTVMPEHQLTRMPSKGLAYMGETDAQAAAKEKAMKERMAIEAANAQKKLEELQKNQKKHRKTPKIMERFKYSRHGGRLKKYKNGGPGDPPSQKEFDAMSQKDKEALVQKYPGVYKIHSDFKSPGVEDAPSQAQFDKMDQQTKEIMVARYPGRYKIHSDFDAKTDPKILEKAGKIVNKIGLRGPVGGYRSFIPNDAYLPPLENITVTDPNLIAPIDNTRVNLEHGGVHYPQPITDPNNNFFIDTRNKQPQHFVATPSKIQNKTVSLGDISFPDGVPTQNFTIDTRDPNDQHFITGQYPTPKNYHAGGWYGSFHTHAFDDAYKYVTGDDNIGQTADKAANWIEGAAEDVVWNVGEGIETAGDYAAEGWDVLSGAFMDDWNSLTGGDWTNNDNYNEHAIKEKSAVKKGGNKQAAVNQATGTKQSLKVNSSGVREYGGYANINPMTYANGGNMGQFSSVPVTEFNNGGSHEANPLGGIPQGPGARVEEGELKITIPGTEQQFIVSPKIKLDKTTAEEFGIPSRYVGKDMVKIFKSVLRKDVFNQREGDTIDNHTQELEIMPFVEAHTYLTDKKNAEEEAKKQAAFGEDMDRMMNEYPEYMQALMAQQQPQQQGPSPEEQAMMEQQMMAQQQGAMPMGRYGGGITQPVKIMDYPQEDMIMNYGGNMATPSYSDFIAPQQTVPVQGVAGSNFNNGGQLPPEAMQQITQEAAAALQQGAPPQEIIAQLLQTTGDPQAVLQVMATATGANEQTAMQQIAPMIEQVATQMQQGQGQQQQMPQQMPMARGGYMPYQSYKYGAGMKVAGNVLDTAAPFLSAIPAVGPILTPIAAGAGEALKEAGSQKAAGEETNWQDIGAKAAIGAGSSFIPAVGGLVESAANTVYDKTLDSSEDEQARINEILSNPEHPEYEKTVKMMEESKKSNKAANITNQVIGTAGQIASGVTAANMNKASDTATSLTEAGAAAGAPEGTTVQYTGNSMMGAGDSTNYSSFAPGYTAGPGGEAVPVSKAYGGKLYANGGDLPTGDDPTKWTKEQKKAFQEWANEQEGSDITNIGGGDYGWGKGSKAAWKKYKDQYLDKVYTDQADLDYQQFLESNPFNMSPAFDLSTIGNYDLGYDSGGWGDVVGLLASGEYSPGADANADKWVEAYTAWHENKFPGQPVEWAEQGDKKLREFEVDANIGNLGTSRTQEQIEKDNQAVWDRIQTDIDNKNPLKMQQRFDPVSDPTDLDNYDESFSDVKDKQRETTYLKPTLAQNMLSGIPGAFNVARGLMPGQDLDLGRVSLGPAKLVDLEQSRRDAQQLYASTQKAMRNAAGGGGNYMANLSGAYNNYLSGLNRINQAEETANAQIVNERNRQQALVDAQNIGLSLKEQDWAAKQRAARENLVGEGLTQWLDIAKGNQQNKFLAQSYFPAIAEDYAEFYKWQTKKEAEKAKKKKT